MVTITLYTHQTQEVVMRVLLTTQPAYGHFHPMLPIATALRNDGHDVRFATGSSSHRQSHVRGLGPHCVYAQE